LSRRQRRLFFIRLDGRAAPGNAGNYVGSFAGRRLDTKLQPGDADGE
jgi:hypothetical protein